MTTPDLSSTRRALHAVAELVLAGPQFRHSGTIRLRVCPGGFGTVAEPDLRVQGTDLVAGDRRFPMTGETIAGLASLADVDPGAPVGLDTDGCGADIGARIDVAPSAVNEILACYARGDTALRQLAPSETPTLWPEHFDLGIGIDEVNYGISPGDSGIDEPYAYIGPWRLRTGAFWTESFGAARPMRDLPDVDSLLAFLAEGRERAQKDPIAG